MVQFPRFRLTTPYGPRCRAFDNSTGYPIRPSADLRMFAPTRGFSQLTTAFLAKQLQGIHRRPLPACHITHLPFPVSDDRCKRPRRSAATSEVRRRSAPWRTLVKDTSSQKTRKRITAQASVIVSVSSAAGDTISGVRHGGMGTRTPDLWLAKPSLWPPELYPRQSAPATAARHPSASVTTKGNGEERGRRTQAKACLPSPITADRRWRLLLKRR